MNFLGRYLFLVCVYLTGRYFGPWFEKQLERAYDACSAGWRRRKARRRRRVDLEITVKAMKAREDLDAAGKSLTPFADFLLKRQMEVACIESTDPWPKPPDVSPCCAHHNPAPVPAYNAYPAPPSGALSDSEQEDAMKDIPHVMFYKDDAGEHRWRILDLDPTDPPDGTGGAWIHMRASEGYAREADCVRGAELTADALHRRFAMGELEGTLRLHGDGFEGAETGFTVLARNGEELATHAYRVTSRQALDAVLLRCWVALVAWMAEKRR
jgi:hypothetical protein